MNKWFTFTHDDPVQFLFLNDIILGPIFFFVLKFCSAIIKTKKNPVYKKFFMSALIVRIVSAIIMALFISFITMVVAILTRILYMHCVFMRFI